MPSGTGSEETAAFYHQRHALSIELRAVWTGRPVVPLALEAWSRGGRTLADDERHRVLDDGPLVRVADGGEQAATGIAPHLTHRLRHRRQGGPRPRSFRDAVERRHREIPRHLDPSLLRRPNEADGQRVVAEHDGCRARRRLQEG